MDVIRSYSQSFHRNKLHLLLVILMVYINMISLINCCDNLFRNHIGTTTPDLMIKEGDPMELNCTLFVNEIDSNGQKINVSSDMLTLKFNGTRVQNSKLRKVDNYTIMYKVKKTSMKDNGYYMCYIDPPGESKKQLVCATAVKIGNVPQDIKLENFHCLGQDLKNITCSWDAPNYNIPTDYTLHMLIGRNQTYSTCPKKEKKNTCTFSNKDPAPYRVSPTTLKFGLESRNKLGEHFQIIEIDHYSHVIPGSVTELVINEIEATRVNITWFPPRSMRFDPFFINYLTYEVIAVPDLSSDIKSFDVDKLKLVQAMDELTIKLILETNQANLSSLIPFTNYTISVRCKVKSAISNDMWSEPVNLKTMTKQDVPYYYPSFTSGSFEIINKADDLRDVVIFFKPVEQWFSNAPNFSYVIKVDSPLSISNTSLSPSSSSSISEEIITDSNIFNYRLVNLHKSTTYNIELFSRNILGLSKGSSHTTIFDTENELPEIGEVFAIDWGQGNFSIYWSTLRSELVSHYSLFWCETLRTNSQCIQPLQNIMIPADKSSYILSLTKGVSYNFAVSVMSGNNDKSLGLKWVSCLEQFDHSHIKDRFKKFDIISAGPKAVKVSWNLDCPALDLIIKRYEIHYCPTNQYQLCDDSPKKAEATKETKEIKIDNLDPNTAYNFTIHALTNRGEDLTSITKVFETTLDSVSLIISVLIITVITLIILGLVYLLFACAIKKRRNQKNLKKIIDNTWIPKMPSRLKGDANILLNPLCQEAPPVLNEYENKEYMNADSTNQLATTNIDEPPHKEANNRLSTISGSHVNSLIGEVSCDGDSGGEVDHHSPDEELHQNRSKSTTLRKSSDPVGGCESVDSGYSTRYSDRHPYYRTAAFNISGIIRQISEDTTYIGSDTVGSPFRSLSDTDLSNYNNSTVSNDHYNGYVVSDFKNETSSSHPYVFE